jgi:hypothetical protein
MENINIERDYTHLKLLRTYIGGSKKEELRIFLDAQGIKKGIINHEDLHIDWFEFRRLVIINFEDIIHVIFSRKLIFKKLSFLFLGLSFCMILLNLITLFFICLSLAIISQIFFNYFKYEEKRNIINYDAIIKLTNNSIKQEFGLNLPDIK